MAGRVYLCGFVALILASAHVSAFPFPLVSPFLGAPIIATPFPVVFPFKKGAQTRLKPPHRPFTLADADPGMNMGMNMAGMSMGMPLPIGVGGQQLFSGDIIGENAFGLTAATNNLNSLNFVGAGDLNGAELVGSPLNFPLASEISDTKVIYNGGGAGQLNFPLGNGEVTDSTIVLNGNGAVPYAREIGDSNFLLNTQGGGSLPAVSDSTIMVNSNTAGALAGSLAY